MRRSAFLVIWLIVSVLLGLGIEWAVKAIFSGQVVSFFTKVYSIGVNPLGISVSVSGILGLILAYLILFRTVKWK